MYTGVADHSLTAELVERVPVPVIASGDVTTRAEAIAVLEQTGAAAAMVARGAQGNPWALRGDDRGRGVRATREEVAAELIVFIREAVRELGEQRGGRLPQEVLRLVPRPRPLPEAVQAGARDAADDRRGRDAAVRGARAPRSS
jgi:tRNA-dihydrouridine synthase